MGSAEGAKNLVRVRCQPRADTMRLGSNSRAASKSEEGHLVRKNGCLRANVREVAEPRDGQVKPI